MATTRRVPVIATAVLMILGVGTALSQPYPSKTIRIVTSEPGGGSDLTSRLIAQGIAGPMGQPVIVDNRGGGTVTVETVLKAAPDGYTILLSASMWLAPLFQNRPYDPFRDFSPISLVASTPNILVVHPSLRVNTVKELIALAKFRPGELDYATGNTGSASYIAAEKFASMAGVKMVRIPFKGAGPAVSALIGGQIQLMFATGNSVTPHIKSGRLRALALTSPRPSALYPELPTVAASGVPGYEANTLFGLFAPAKTSAEIINRLNQEISRMLARAEVKEKLLSIGAEPEGGSPEQWTGTMKTEIAVLSKIVKDSGLRTD